MRHLDRAGGAPGHRGEQCNRALDGAPLLGRIDATLKALAGVGLQAQAARAPQERIGREVRGLQEHVRGRLAHRGAQSPHDARQSHRALAVGDQQDLGWRADGIAIEERDRLSGARQTHPDVAPELLQIVGVHGLSQLEHHVVGDIHHRADGAHTGAPQPLTHPQRRLGAIVDAAQDAAGEPWACCRRFEVHRQPLRMSGGRAADRGARDFGVGKGCHLAGDADDRHGVAAIGGDIQIEHGLVERQVLAQGSAERGILRQLQDSGRGVRQAELLRGGEHALGLHPTQLRRLDGEVARQLRTHQRERTLQAGARIAGTAHDLQRCAAPGRHAAHLQLVRLRVRLSAHDLRDQHPCEGRRRRTERLELDPGHGEA